MGKSAEVKALAATTGISFIVFMKTIAYAGSSLKKANQHFVFIDDALSVRQQPSTYTGGCRVNKNPKTYVGELL